MNPTRRTWVRARSWRWRSADSPRPAGRRLTRGLRRGGTIARRVLIGRRRVVTGAETTTSLPADVALTPRADSLPGDLGAEVHRARAGAGRRPRSAGTILRPTKRRASAPEADEIVTVDSPPLLTGDRTPARMRRFVLVQACTVSSVLLGMTAIFLALAGEVQFAAVALASCVVFDGIDGALARKFRVSTPFGGQMDSLADMCSFGIATPVVAYAWLSGSAPPAAVAVACSLIAICAAIRLARFNVSPKNGYYFEGVPTTMAAAIIVSSVLVQPALRPSVLVLAIGLLGLLMVSTFPYMKIGQVLRVPPALWVALAVLIWADWITAFSIVIGFYLLSGPLLWAKQRFRVTA
jgi:CDP-diacylglycerol--serine O-phosphatidyltransferase